VKTHDLAKALTQLGKVLKGLPNQDLEDLGLSLSESTSSHASDVGISLSALASLSKFNKSDWEKIIRDYELSIDVRPRDAARDVMGKILTYLAENEAERKRVAMKSHGRSHQPSELSNALRFLLTNG
jgi:hypothetical protein